MRFSKLLAVAFLIAVSLDIALLVAVTFLLINERRRAEDPRIAPSLLRKIASDIGMTVEAFVRG